MIAVNEFTYSYLLKVQYILVDGKISTDGANLISSMQYRVRNSLVNECQVIK